MASTKLAEPEPAQPSPEQRPASTVAPVSTPPSPEIATAAELARKDARTAVTAGREPVPEEEPE